MSTLRLKQGARVSTKNGLGFVAYLGPTDFSNGTWVGIILDLPNGKNDGSVNGKRYFTCRSSAGVFVRPSQVTVLLNEPKPSRLAAIPSPTPAIPRPSSNNSNISSVSKTFSTHSNILIKPSTSTSTKAKSPGPNNPRTLSRLSNLSTIKSPPKSPISNRFQPMSPNPIQTPQKNTKVNTATASTASRAPSASISYLSHSTSPVTNKTNNANNHPPPPTLSRTYSLSARPSTKKSTVSLESTSQQVTSTIHKPPNSLANLMATAQSSSNQVLSLFEEDLIMTNTSIADVEVDDTNDLDAPFMPSLKPSQSINSTEPPATDITATHHPQDSLDTITQLSTSSPNPPLSVSALKSSDRPNPKAIEYLISSPLPLSPIINHNQPISTRSYEELLTKYKLMEQRRVEDKEKLRVLEKVKDENDHWSTILKPKLQSKVDQSQEEIKNLKKLNKELELSRQEIETRLADFSDEVELATLDKEMAEEKLDQTESLLVGLKDQLESAQVELTSLKEVYAKIESGQADGNENQSINLKLIQSEKQNSRLKEALSRMRDLSQESEQASRKRIADLEQELDLSGELQGEYSVLLSQLETAESQVEELKQQLDASMGVEDMLEQLTERNLTLNEKIDDMQAIIEDLEALKELADELEENHVETEKQMQEEIDFKDMQLREQKKRNESLEESVADYENTILQFRELVLSLQSDLDGMREKQQIQYDESQSLASQTHAMLNLNRKLQSSSVKGQVKAIDLELRKLESAQAVLQCNIMKPYLLPAYFEGDHDAVESLLFFTRLAAKSDLVSSVIEQTNNISECTNEKVTEVVLIACDTRSKLARLSALSNRFAAFIRSCPPDSFIKMGGVYQELISAEKKIDSFIDACKKEELKEVDVGKEIEKYLPQLRHLAEIYMTGSDYDVAELQYGDLCTLDVELDSVLACITFVMQTIASLEEEAVEGQESRNLSDFLIRPLQNLLGQARIAKVVSKKLLRRLHDLMRQSCSLNPNHSNAITVLKDNTYDLANVSSRMADLVGRYCSELTISKEVFQLETYQDIVQEATRDIVRQSGRPLEEFYTLLSHLARDLGITLGVATDPEHVARNSFDHPWTARVAEMRSSAAMSVDAEVRVLKLKEEIRELVKDIQAKDHALQESQVKIQVMDKRMEAVKKQSETMIELESQLKKTDKELKQYEELTESIQNEYDKLAEENKELKVKLATATTAIGIDPSCIKKSMSTEGLMSNGSALPSALSGISGHEFYVPYEGNLETAQLVEQIESLRGATRFLRAENSYIKSQSLMKQLNSLPTYSELPPKFPPVLETDQQGLDVGMTGSNFSRGRVMNNLDQVRKLNEESKKLYREALFISANSKVVDLSIVKRPNLKSSSSMEQSNTTTMNLTQSDHANLKIGRCWQVKDRLPHVQFRKRQEEIQRLKKKIDGFKQRTHEIKI